MRFLQILALVLALIQIMRDQDLPAMLLEVRVLRVTEIVMMMRMKMVESLAIKSCLETTVRMSVAASTAAANQSVRATNQMPPCTQTMNTAGLRADARRTMMTMTEATGQM